jgi:hypothetical protein
MTFKQRLHKLACRAYAWAEKHWFAKLVYVGSPLVRLLDASVGSECKYCMAFRALMVGFGLGIGGVAGAFLVVSALVLTLVEHICKE